MLAVKCPFCQHENNPGTRFCAECGFSMHLKICPNPKCGQISGVDAVACEHCGQSFPKTAPVPAGISPSMGTTSSAASAGTQKHGGDSTTAGKERPRAAALPLIMMAIVAGGLPMIWANRDLLPTPKTWKMSSPGTAKTDAVVSVPIAPSAPPKEPALTLPSTSVNSASASPPDKAVVTGEVGSGGPASNLDATASTTKIGEGQPARVDTAKKVVKAPRVKATEPPRPCTEATIALGLCDPKKATK